MRRSDCVTVFPVGGGDAVDRVPLLRMWFRTSRGNLRVGVSVVELPQAQLHTWVSGERYQTERLKPFTRLKLRCVYILSYGAFMDSGK